MNMNLISLDYSSNTNVMYIYFEFFALTLYFPSFIQRLSQFGNFLFSLDGLVEINRKKGRKKERSKKGGKKD